MEYPFADESFDHVICYSVLPHLEQKSAAVERFAAALKPGGLLSVLHSSSKEKINGVHIHAHSRDINSDCLLPAFEYIPLLNKNGLREEIVIDNSEMFMFCARRQWRR
jgi:demethylmenaquinone methyltransferase/2-methoxy-6-polyprenyl-1,4-benzoquinol methylase